MLYTLKPLVVVMGIALSSSCSRGPWCLRFMSPKTMRAAQRLDRADAHRLHEPELLDLLAVVAWCCSHGRRTRTRIRSRCTRRCCT
jgi:hypothetical protein